MPGWAVRSLGGKHTAALSGPSISGSVPAVASGRTYE